MQDLTKMGDEELVEECRAAWGHYMQPDTTDFADASLSDACKAEILRRMALGWTRFEGTILEDALKHARGAGAVSDGRYTVRIDGPSWSPQDEACLRAKEGAD